MNLMRLWTVLGLVFLTGLRAQTRNVILVTADGLRWQDVFHGVDPMLAHEKSAGMENAGERLKKYTSREKLMPFFWTKLAPKGIVLSDVKVTNAFRVSYPGYSEILTGRAADDVITSNRAIRNPNETVLEFLRRKMALPREKVALFASWDTFRAIGEHTEGSIYLNAGYHEIDKGSPRLLELSRMQMRMLTPWEEARHDYITGAMALEHMRKVKPRALFVSFDETDDWAHGHRYDRVLDSMAEFDRFLETLWTAIESMKEYRGKTTLIVTSDHGRGSTLTDWNGHGRNVVGADRIWMAIVGPEVRPVAESDLHVEQRDIAPTIVKLMGFDPADYPGMTGKPIELRKLISASSASLASLREMRAFSSHKDAKDRKERRGYSTIPSDRNSSFNLSKVSKRIACIPASRAPST